MEFYDWWNHPDHIRYRGLVLEGQERIMANLDALNAAVSELESEQAEVVAALNDLSAKVAAGDPVSQADIDAITARIGAASDSIHSAVEADDPSEADGSATVTAPAAPVVVSPDAPSAPTSADPTVATAAGSPSDPTAVVAPLDPDFPTA